MSPRKNTKAYKAIKQKIEVNSNDIIYAFSNLGKIYNIKVNDLLFHKECYSLQDGEILVNLSNSNGDNIIITTRKGICKKSSAADLSTNRKTGKIAIKLEQDNSVVGGYCGNNDDYILLISSEEKGFLCPLGEFPVSGAATKGVKGINLKDVAALQYSALVKKGQEEIEYNGKKKNISHFKIGSRGIIGNKI